MQSLADWRLRMAAELLRDTMLGVAGVAYRVGHDSEEALNRASSGRMAGRRRRGGDMRPAEPFA
jgi:transcriptional regulator GlxA family with amidase domain